MKSSVTTPPSARRLTVAIVEDDANLRESFARLLQRAPDFECVATFPDAETAVEQMLQVKPDIALVDINLPGINGVECCGG